MHDSGRSGWWLLIFLIPIVGWIILIVLLCLPTKAEPEAYDRPAVPDGDAAEQIQISEQKTVSRRDRLSPPVVSRSSRGDSDHRG